MDKFVKENTKAKVDVDFLFIARANLEWRNIVIEQALDECFELLKEVGCLKEIVTVDIKCIDVKTMGNENQN